MFVQCSVHIFNTWLQFRWAHTQREIVWTCVYTRTKCIYILELYVYNPKNIYFLLGYAQYGNTHTRLGYTGSQRMHNKMSIVTITCGNEEVNGTFVSSSLGSWRLMAIVLQYSETETNEPSILSFRWPWVILSVYL